ncbi:hypothetical protein D2T29_19695 [Sinirhodobacter populi]|uniref:Uncharacterized protein n=1 Tax=Paenirhodobacter populi TaxID=2306993 RepID=A0A443K262_9RHOB|nr:hypothetical protein [Sinirhodobacter populi]RWR26803.1 hypothetical protein D2T29_19695 [Sinirhodobacter populi]
MPGFFGMFRDAFRILHSPDIAMMPGYTPPGMDRRYAPQWAAGKREAEVARETRQLRRARERRSRKQQVKA